MRSSHSAAILEAGELRADTSTQVTRVQHVAAIYVDPLRLAVGVRVGVRVATVELDRRKLVH